MRCVPKEWETQRRITCARRDVTPGNRCHPTAVTRWFWQSFGMSTESGHSDQSGSDHKKTSSAENLSSGSVDIESDDNNKGGGFLPTLGPLTPPIYIGIIVFLVVLIIVLAVVLTLPETVSCIPDDGK